MCGLNSELDTPFLPATPWFAVGSAICCPSGPTRRHGHLIADPSDQASSFFERLDQASGPGIPPRLTKHHHPQRAKKLAEAMPTCSRLGRDSSGIAHSLSHGLDARGSCPSSMSSPWPPCLNRGPSSERQRVHRIVCQTCNLHAAAIVLS